MAETEPVDLTKRPDKQGLKKLLCDSLPKNIREKKIDFYFNLDVLLQHRRKLKSPLDFIQKNILYSITLQTFLKKFIECQFQLKWATDNGLPREFSYYDFCEVVCQHWTQRDMDKKVLKNTVRSAQVKVQLYRFYTTHIQNEFDVRDLCPKVYVRTGEMQWQSIDLYPRSASGRRHLVALEADGVNNFDWISEPIQRYILSEGETIPEAELGDARLTEWLTKPTLYWAVVEDSNFQAGENLKLNQIGRTQVYVGKAMNGIKDRWLTNGSSHCRKMKNCLDAFRDNETYNAKLVSDVQLVDAVLLLEKLKGNANSALFLMKTFDGKKKLRDAEKSNIVGKRSSDDSDIIPLEELIDVNDDSDTTSSEEDVNDDSDTTSSEEELLPWKPIYMAYGMNIAR